MCKYCFYRKETEGLAERGVMTAGTVSKLLASVHEYTDVGDVVSICFQGGEPTVASLDFYKNWIEEEKKYKDIHFSHSIQTNGILLDESWADFFSENSFLVGISVDGYRELHDKFRTDFLGNGSFERVEQSIDLLKKHKVAINALCVVTRDCANKPHRVYRKLKELGFDYIQFIACIDGDKPEEYSLSSDFYGNFLCNVFDDWYSDWESGKYTSVRLFDDFVHLLCNREPSSCSLTERCPKHLIVESDGSFYPCDFFVGNDYELGNINKISVREALESKKAETFRNNRTNPEECKSCRFFKMCNSGCRYDFLTDENGKQTNRYCMAFKSFFSYAFARLEHIAKQELLLENRQYGK